MNDIHEKILSALASEKKALKIKEIASLTGLDPHTAARSLDVLEVLGKVRKIVVGTSKKYHLIESIPVFRLIDISSDLIIILDTDLSIQYINKRAKDFFNITDRNIIGQKLEGLNLDLFSGHEILDGLRSFSFEKVYRTEIYYTYHDTGFWYAVSIIGLALSPQERKIAIIAEDITDKKQYQQKIIENEEKLRSITQNIPGIVFRYNIRHNIHEIFNDNLERITGYTTHDITSHYNLPFYSVIHPDDIPGILPVMLESVRRGSDYTLQYRIFTKDKRLIHVYEQGRVIHDHEGQAEYIDGVIFDISDIVLNASRYKNLFDSAPIALVEDDFSEFYTFISHLKKKGISDFQMYFDTHPEMVKSCEKYVKNVDCNAAFLRLIELGPEDNISFFEKSSIFPKESEKTKKELLIALAEGKTTYQGEIPIRTAKGNIRNLIVRVSVVPDTPVPLSRVLISCIDDTERKKSRAELEKKKRNLQAIFDNTYAAFLLIDKNFTIQAFNAVAQEGSYQIFHRTMSEGDSIWDYVREEDKESFYTHMKKAFAGEKIETELKFKLPDGSEQWYEFHYSPVYDENGSIDLVFFTSQNISEKKQTEEAFVQLSRERLLLAEEAGRQGMYEINLMNGTVTFSAAFYAMHGYPFGSFYASTDVWPALIHPDDAPRLMREREESLHLKNTFSSEYRIKHHDGNWMWVEGRQRVISRDEYGNPEVIIGIHTDITQRKQNEEALKESELRLRQIADATDDALFMHCGGEILKVNHSAVRMFGYSEEELQSMHVLSLVAPDYRNYVKERLLDTNDVIYEADGITKDGRILKLRVKATNTPSEGRTIRFSAVKNITPLLEQEKEIKENIQKVRSIIDNSPDAITLIDEQGVIIEWNPAAETIFGIPCSEAMGQRYCDLLPSMIIPEHRIPERIQYLTSAIREALNTGRSDLFRAPLEGQILRPDGTRRNIRQTVFFIPTEKGYRLGSITLDTTGEKENENRLLTAHLDLQAAYEQISAAEEEMRANYEELAAKNEELERSRELLKLKLDHILTPEYNITDEELANIIDCEEIQHIMDDFYALTGIGVGIVDLNGSVLIATGWQDICTKFHRVNAESSQNCRESDLTLTKNMKPGEIRAYKCKNNLWDIATPIMIGSRHVGNLFLGQFFYTDEAINRELFREQAERYGFDSDAYLAALDRVPRWSKETVDTVLDFYKRFAGLISRLSYSNVRLAKTLADYEQILQQLAKSQEKYRRYSEFAPHGIIVADESGRLVDVNPMICELLGYTRDELLTMGVGSLYPEEGRVQAEERFLQLIRTGYSSFESRMQRKDGETIPILLNAVSLPDNQYMAFVIDLTEKEEAKRRQAAALEQIEKNIYQLSTLNDQIRNPLTIINSLCEMDEPAHYDQIQEQIMRIDQIIRKTDQGWLESSKIREYLKKHHGIIVSDHWV